METAFAPTQFGMPTHNVIVEDVMQQYDDTCAIKSQELILNSAGIPYTEDELVKEAIQNGWYEPGKGTSVDDVGKLLVLHGLDVAQFHDASIFNLVSELSKGYPVIVGVDSGELWNPGFEETFEDFINPYGADHALLVSGIEFNEDFSNATVNLIDPGSGDFSKGYALAQFEDALADSDHFMVSII